MMAYVILDEELYNKKFIDERTKGFEEYKQSILNDPYANPDFFRQLPGYEYLAKMIPNIAREYAIKKSMIFWGLGISEHFDGSYAVMAITHLALLTGNIGKVGAGLMPLRGQNNVQGTCDMGVLPYYAPDYQEPKEIGLMTPQIIDAMLDGEIKAILNMGEDILHIHPNVNKTEKAFKNLEFLMVQELFMTEIAKEADIVVGVKSAYEKTGVYINAMRRLHLSQPLVQAEMPDDWEVIQMLDNKLQGSFNYENSNDVWDEVREVAHRRFSGASYHRLEMHRKRGLQWPIHQEDTPVLHLLDFRKDDGLGHFHYHQYHQRGMIDEILNDEFTGFHLTTGRTIAHYNNAAQTKRSEKLNKRYEEDILLVSPEDADHFPTDYVILKNVYGQTTPIKVKFVDSVRPKTLYTTFHHAKSNINRIFGDKRDELIMTAAFKSIKVEIEPFQG
jgi:formate dehydrogenase major subunit